MTSPTTPQVQRLVSRPRVPGQVLAQRRKGVVVWQARISADRHRLEVVGLIPPSPVMTTIEPLNARELQALLDGEPGQ